MAATFSILRPEFALPFPFLSVFFSFLKKAAFGRGLGAGTNGYHGDFDLAPPKRIEGKSQGGPHTQRHILLYSLSTLLLSSPIDPSSSVVPILHQRRRSPHHHRP
jgi:hypothetical protein